MKYKTKNVRFRGNEEIAARVQAWIEEQDSPVTVRRVFYAMVTRELIDNLHAEYRRISDIVVKLRRGGLLDWDLIEDDTRRAYKDLSYRSIEGAVHRAIEAFRYDRWANQDHHLQVWVEKRGHVPILYRVTNEYDVSVVENGGRCALTPQGVEPFIRAQQAGKKNVILYVGDYDPSGLQMDQNMMEQLTDLGVDCTWRRVALTYQHLYAYNLPRKFIIEAKTTMQWLSTHPDVDMIRYEGNTPIVNKLEKDPNARWFKDRHDGELYQVEVDALEADLLRDLVERAIIEYADIEELARVEIQEEQDRSRIRSLLP